MDTKRFDELAKRVGTSRRSVLKKMVGLGGAVAVAGLSMRDAEAARRGYSGPGTGGAPNDTFHECRLLEPKCCINCTVSASDWHDVVQDRLYTCFYDGVFTNCATCAQVATWGGIRGWCEAV